MWPLAETAEVVEAYKEIIAMPEVKIFGFGMGDASMSLAKSDRPDFYHPLIWQRIDEAVEYGKNTTLTPTPKVAERPTADLQPRPQKQLLNAAFDSLLPVVRNITGT